MKIMIIGGGAAGLIACGVAAKSADEVILIEKNDRLGKKLLITGKGRCNITNAAEIEDMILQYPTNAKFLYSALYSFTNDDIVSLIEENGVKTKVERGGRVFPVSDKASDVVMALKRFAIKHNVKVISSRAQKLVIKDNKVCGALVNDKVIEADKVIVCTGGKSYPGTGSTGDGYKFAREAGHTITPLKPSLVPLETEEAWAKSVMGLSLKNTAITVYNSKNKAVYEDFGEMLFTHFGVSGPIILSASSRIKDLKNEKYYIKIDLKPALDIAKLDLRILRDFEKYKKKQLLNSLDDLLPKSLIDVIIDLSGINPHKNVCEITREERASLVSTIKGLKLTIKDFRPINEAIITSGGIKVSEIDPSTMQSKLIKDLYFAGEVIDVDGYTGGYNLQAAFSTGYLAAQSAVECV